MSDEEPGIARRRRGRGFQYIGPDGATITSKDERSRIEALAIPPAWTDVWICPSRNGHIQATGRDARGRKQYRYHPRWREVRDATKYHRLAAFAEALPRIRRRVDRDMRRPSLSRERIVATVVRLLDLKGGKVHEVDVHDPRVARVIRRCEELPGQSLFQYVDDDGEPVDVTSDDVNDYIRAAAGAEFTAKDFRTWTGTVLAAWTLDELGGPVAAAKKHLVAAMESVAEELGNTPAVCRACYVHPEVIDAHRNGTLRRRLSRRGGRTPRRRGLSSHEARVLALLERHTAS